MLSICSIYIGLLRVEALELRGQPRSLRVEAPEPFQFCLHNPTITDIFSTIAELRPETEEVWKYIDR